MRPDVLSIDVAIWHLPGDVIMMISTWPAGCLCNPLQLATAPHLNAAPFAIWSCTPGLYPCSTKTKEDLGNPSPMPERFPETQEILRVEGNLSSFGGAQTFSHHPSLWREWIRKSGLNVLKSILPCWWWENASCKWTTEGAINDNKCVPYTWPGWPFTTSGPFPVPSFVKSHIQKLEAT